MTIPQERTALYRLLAANGRLLYVGISSNPDFRWGAHSNSQPWWNEVADRKIEWFPDRQSAAGAEVRAIWEERPLYNKQNSVVSPRVEPDHSGGERSYGEEMERPPYTGNPIDLAAIRTRYEYAVEDAEKQRTEDVLEALKAGSTQKDIADATGYTRETVRRIANPEAAEAIREARRAKKEQTA